MPEADPTPATESEPKARPPATKQSSGPKPQAKPPEGKQIDGTVPTSQEGKASSQKPNNNPLIAFITIAVVGIMSLVYITTGADPFKWFTSTPTPTWTAMAATSIPAAETPTPDVSRTGNWWQVIFTDPILLNDPENWKNSIEGKLIERINRAEVSIDIAAFEFDLTPVAEALVAAKKRGVAIRWMTDDEHGTKADAEPGHGQFKLLKKAGIELKDDNRAALMHNKFMIFDKKTVWTGSTNLTTNGIFKNNNNVIVINSTKLANIYQAEFDEMWAGKHGPSSPSTRLQQAITIGKTPIQVYFSAEDESIRYILPYVINAQKSIRFMAFSFTHSELAEAMITRAKQGVDVRGIYETRGSQVNEGELRFMFCARLPMRQDGNPSSFHHKVIVIDEKIVVTGSLNFSENADRNNDENVIIIDNAAIAAPYLQEFERRWLEGKDPNPTDLRCPTP